MVKKMRNTAILAFICTAIYVLVPEDFMQGYLDDVLMILMCLFTVSKYQRMKDEEQEDNWLL